MFDAADARPWMRGFMLWHCPPTLYAEADAAANDDYCPYGKPAGEYLREKYRSKTAS
jgi:hypothetical protein